MNWATFNTLEFQLPDECVADCSAQGRCDEAVEYWQNELGLNLDREKMITELTEWLCDHDDIPEWDNERLEQYMIWIAANNIKESINQGE